MKRSPLKRLVRFFYREPDFCIGGKENPYIRRWWVIPRNRYFNIYLHNQLRDDDDRALHDHPWYNVSIILKGGYIEHMPVDKRLYPDDYREMRKLRRAGRIIFRKPTHAHRLTLRNEVQVMDWSKADPLATSAPIRKPQSWSIFITGPRVREWGFWCIDKKKREHRWVHWRAFTDPTDTGKTGKGCAL
jgi:hypothetical protein